MDVAKIFKKTPYLADLKPGGKYVAKDMWKAGGVPMLLKTLMDGGYIHGDCMTVTGKTMRENLKNVKFKTNQKVMRKYSNPITSTGGVVDSVTVAAAGDGQYQVNDVVTITGGGNNAQVTITSVRGAITAVVVTGGDPALEQMKIINTKTFDIIKALKGQQVAKKKRAKSKKNLFQWMSRKNREEDREEGKGALMRE